MIYYGLVDSIKDIHKSGVYGRKLPANKNVSISSSEILSLTTTLGESFEISISPQFSLFGPLLHIDFRRRNNIKFLYNPFEEDKDYKLLMISYKDLENNYSIKDELELLYGLFDGFNFPKDAFKSIMQSKGGSKLIIVEKDKIAKKHYGGEHGNFNSGLYTEHPKNRNILIPLENSTELIKSLILEEMLGAFEALGAKKIVIEDITNIDAKARVDDKSQHATGGTSLNLEKQKIRIKEFGKGVFDSQRAMTNKYFLPDFPNLMTTINSRIYGNQTREVFTESINLGASLDINVLKLFEANLSFDFNRKWHIEIDFYDKTEINEA